MSKETLVRLGGILYDMLLVIGARVGADMSPFYPCAECNGPAVEHDGSWKNGCCGEFKQRSDCGCGCGYDRSTMSPRDACPACGV